MNYSTTKQMWTKVAILSLLCIAGTYLAPMHAQESCYEQYLREHNKKILTAEDADDSYDELKKTVLAKQMYGDSYLLMVDTIAQRAVITKVDGTYVADVHVALVDSTWYMWLSVDPLADKYPGNTPYMYCNGNPIKFIDPDGRNPVYDLDGNFLGVDDLGLQGEAIFMQSSLFSNGMDNIDAVKQNVGMDNLSPQARETFQNHYANLYKRPDWDGVVTASEGIAWAWQHPDALQYPTADNMLYINVALLDFGNITTSDCTNGLGAVSAINLLNKDNLTNALTNPALRNTVYALGRVDVRLINAAGLIQVVNNNATDYDWNKGGGALRNSLIQLELLRTQLPQGSGFKTFYYGYGSIRTK